MIKAILWVGWVKERNPTKVSMCQFVLKHLQSQHLDQVVNLDKICLGGIWTKEGYQRELESPNSELLGLFIEEEILIGFGCFWAILEEAHLTILMIHPDYQGQGLGKFLLFSLLKLAVNRNLERATLEVNANNKKALTLYQKFGFKIAGTRKGYYQKTGEDALILWRNDLQQPDFLETVETLANLC
jgi:ribosomal-protein-alanine N-acetyltransferase